MCHLAADRLSGQPGGNHVLRMPSVDYSPTDDSKPLDAHGVCRALSGLLAQPSRRPCSCCDDPLRPPIEDDLVELTFCRAKAGLKTNAVWNCARWHLFLRRWFSLHLRSGTLIPSLGYFYSLLTFLHVRSPPMWNAFNMRAFVARFVGEFAAGSDRENSRTALRTVETSS